MSNLKDKLHEKADNINQASAALALIKSEPELNSESQIINFTQSETLKKSSVVPDFAISLNEAKQRIALLQEFVKELMVPEVDFGIIPGCKKPSLYKAGAEKLCDIFGFSKQIEVINRVENWENGIFHYEVKAVLINKRTGYIEAEGIGCCNSKEKKYKDLSSFNVINTILKMAKKRALIDAVLSATRSSGLFTQDIEDTADLVSFCDSDNSSCRNPLQDIQKSNTQTADSNNATINSNAPKLVTPKQLLLLQSIVSDKGVDNSTIKNIMKQRYNVENSKSLTCKQASDLIKYLNNYQP